ncbi:MAG: methyltransferase domain-containing protein [Elusimicrobia bacterium]|nr:methyltransferase domain-containing protein [Elusimicrobiota bacterium]
MEDRDILESLNRAMLRQGWIFGDKANRIGHPFDWIDGERVSYWNKVQGVQALLQYVAMAYEQYPTPAQFKTPDYDEMLAHCEDTVTKLIKHYLPFPVRKEWGLDNFIKSAAVIRTQDYAFIKTFAGDLAATINHLDIGPGVGSHAIYSLKGFSSNYYAVEASPHSYCIQRLMFRFLSPLPGSYLDTIECENFGLNEGAIVAELNNKNQYRIKHVPSWLFPLVSTESIDLVTATWVLNEVSFAGILWLMANASRALRQGGYVYIRDSGKLKPGRHSISYDNLLTDIGFEEIERLKITKNRLDYYGVPRLYQKKTGQSYSFEELVERFLGKFAVVSHGGSYIQNMDEVSAREKVSA